jgi:hypothetical protein
MQLDGALQGGASTSRPRRRLLNVLVAIVVIAAMVGLLVMIWASPFARSGGVGAEDAIPSAGPAVIHDDSWSVVPRNAGFAVNHDDAGYVNRD